MNYCKELIGMDMTECSEMYTKLNATDQSYKKEKAIHQLFEEQVIRSTHAIAAKYHQDFITYEELNSRANHIAKKLRDAGVQANVIVALMVQRSIDMLIGMLGILKAGGCYLPIDPKFPKARIEYMLEDSKAKLLLTQHSVGEVKDYDGMVFYLDEEKYDGIAENLPNINTSSDLAYMIYTSGSTGKPKGVMLEHQSVHNFICGETKEIDFNPIKKIVSLTTISFDIFVLESLLPLIVGMQIIIADPMNFSEDLQEETVQMLQTTPSTMLLILNDERNYKYLDSLTDIMLGGEAFPDRLLEQLKKLTTARIFNMYGPTETTVWSTIKELTDTDFITIGYPIANTQIYLIDEECNILPFGKEGEICIAGDGLARGYFDRPELTKERFIQNKMLPGVQMYRTGDLGKILDNGEILYIGRIDSQVKIRGFRIELGEIETALLKVKGVNDCVVVAKQNQLGEKYLIGYYQADKELEVSYMIECLRKTLPDYMIPGFYRKIDQIPLTPSGKINRLALPDIELKRANITLVSQYIEPVTVNEKKIVELWKSIFNLDQIGVEDDFFYLGGNSILLSKLHIELEKQNNKKLSIAELFVNTTIRQQCSLLEGTRQKEVHIKMNTVCFPKEFYLDKDNPVSISELQYTIDMKVCRKLEIFTKLANVNLESALLSLYLFVMAKYTGQNKLMVLLRESEVEEYRVILQDTTVSSDLEELCREVYGKMSMSTQLVGKNMLERYIFEEVQEVVPVFVWNGKKEKQSGIGNTIKIALTKTENGLVVTFSYDENCFNRNEIVKFFQDYLKLVEIVAAEVEEEG